MKMYTQRDLAEIIAAHRKWIQDKFDGKRANLSGSDLRGSNLRGSNLRGSNLSHSDLRGSNLSGSDLSHSNLSGSDLRGSNLSGSDLSHSNLSGSDLRGSNLRGSDLSHSNLSGSDLRGSNLRGSNLRGSKLSCSDLSGAEGVAVLSVGDPRGYRPIAVQTAYGWMIASGCRWLSVADAREHWSAPDYHTPWIGARYVAALDWLEAWSVLCAEVAA